MPELSPKQIASIIEAVAQVNIWDGSVRSGKTLASVIAFLDTLARSEPGSIGRVVIVGKTQDTIYRNVISTIVDLLGTGSDGIHYTRGAPTAQILGHEVDIIGAADARSEGRIRGMTIRLAYVDEASLLPNLDYWHQLIARQMTVAEPRTFVTTNPDGPSHWLKTEVIDRAEELGYRYWHFTLDDNPVLTEKAKAQAAKANAGVFYQRNILGLWVIAEGSIYDMWDAALHVTDDSPTDVTEWHVAIDDGTAGTFAAQLIACTPDRLIVAREFRWNAKERQRQLTDSQKSEQLKVWLDECAEGTRIHDGAALPKLEGCNLPRFIHVDPSATSLIRQLELDGWRGVVTKARNDVLDGIKYTSSLLALGRLLVHRSCAGLIGEIGGYVWDPKAAEKGEDKPVKVNDHHCLVAGTMVQTAGGSKSIESISPGDLVATRQGLKPVRWAAMTGRSREVWRVTTSTGATFDATPDHPVWVESVGWVRVDALRYGDILTTCQVSKQLNTTASLSGDTQTRRGGLIAAIGRLARRIASEVFAGCTRSFGLKPTGRSRAGTTSITPTSIRSTTTSPIWCVSRARITNRSIMSGLWRWAGSIRRAHWRGSGLLSGIAVTRVEHGTESTGSGRGTPESRSPRHASSAGLSTKPKTSATVLGSAPTTARALGGERPSSTTSSGNASAAGQRSPAIDTTRPGSVGAHVLSAIPLADRADVYNLSVDGPPEFFANGVLVHNCDATRYGVMGTHRHWWGWLAAEP